MIFFKIGVIYKMKILHITDIEGYSLIFSDEILQDLDFVVISGDLTVGSKSMKNIVRSFNKIRSVIPTEIPIYYIPGNRDYPVTITDFEGKPENFTHIHNKHIKIRLDEKKDIYFIGYGSALPGLLNNFTRTEEEIKNSLDILFEKVKKEKKSEDIVILLTHNPPINSTLDKTFTNLHIGSISVREAIEKYEPDILLCGHVHESQSQQKIGKTLCNNPGASKSGNATILEFNDEIKVKIIKFEANLVKRK